MKKKFFNFNNKKKNNTLRQLLKAKELGYREAVDFSIENYSAVVLLCLKDKFDFTSDELKDMVDYINDTFDSIDKGYLSFNDIITTLLNEDGINVRFLKEVTNE